MGMEFVAPCADCGAVNWSLFLPAYRAYLCHKATLLTNKGKVVPPLQTVLFMFRYSLQIGIVGRHDKRVHLHHVGKNRTRNMIREILLVF